MPALQNLIEAMTLEEKASLCSGSNFWELKEIKRLGIPSIRVADGPHGLRKETGGSGGPGLHQSVPSTCFPTASALAATWNRELIFQVGVALADECRQEKVGVILGPGANIKRSPLCGRNFEYFSEDPYLTGEMARSYIQGVQSRGIGTSLKHYAANNQEYRRLTIDTIVDERALREIYLAGFEIAVREAQPWTVMGAYNKVNGTYCCEHPQLLRQILKEEWQHEGLVITDWGAMNERVDAQIAGLDLEMPGSKSSNDQKIISAVQAGIMDEAVLDQAVERVLALIFKAHETLSEEFSYSPDAHHALARQVAGEGTVLLKNAAGALPLKPDLKVALLGAFAKTPRYQGAGSSLINPSKLDTLYGEMVKIAGESNILYAPGYPLKGSLVEDALIEDAVQAAREADVVVVSAGLPDSFEVEGLDRTHLRLPAAHNQLIETISALHDRVVVVLSNGSPVEMPWIDQVQAVLEGYLGGQAGAGGMADILYGIVNPSGKLAETFPVQLEDTPTFRTFPGGPKTVEYRESIFVGYRFFNTVEKDVLFPFGHGLSYTTFEYRDLHLSQNRITDQETLTASLRVKNPGPIAGKEIVQLYVSPQEPTAFRPTAELKGFEKVSLLPGEEKLISFTLDHRAFAYFNTAINDWHVESGRYTIHLGASSRDLRLSAEVRLDSIHPEVPIHPRDRHPAYTQFPADAQISQQEFEQLLGRPVPGNRILKSEPYTLNTPVGDLQGSFIGRQLRNIIRMQVKGLIEKNPESPNAQMLLATAEQAPLRSLMLYSDLLSRELVDGLLLMMNGKTFPGLFAVLKAVTQKK